MVKTKGSCLKDCLELIHSFEVRNGLKTVKKCFQKIKGYSGNILITAVYRREGK